MFSLIICHIQCQADYMSCWCEVTVSALSYSNMSLQTFNVDRGVRRWPIRDSFTGNLRGKFSEGTTFSLAFSPLGERASLRWTGTSVPFEVNTILNLRIVGVSGQILLNESWQVTNLKCNDMAVEIVYPARIDHWASWTQVEVQFQHVAHMGLTGKTAPQSRLIAKGEFQHSASSTTAATNVEPQSGQQSDPIKPVAKTEQSGPGEDRIDLKSVLSEPTAGQPPVKRQKFVQSPAAVSNGDVNSAATGTAVILRTTQLFPGDLRESADTDQLIQTKAKVSQLEEENLRLTSDLSELQQKLNEIDAEAKLKLTEKAAELTELRLNFDRLELERKTQDDLVAQLQSQLSVKTEEIDKELELNKVKLNQLASELADQQQWNERNRDEITRQSFLIAEQLKVEETLRSQISNKNEEIQQLAEWKKICEEEMVKQLSLETLTFTIRLANKIRSDPVMAKVFEFVKEKASVKMWKDLQLLCAEIPDLFAQLIVFSCSGANAEFPKFHFTSGVDHM